MYMSQLDVEGNIIQYGLSGKKHPEGHTYSSHAC